MFRTLSAAALVAVVSAPALAQPVVLKGQYAGTTQYTATIDPSGTCAGLGVAPGVVNTSEATVGGLGKAFTSTIANPSGAGTQASPYTTAWINCSFPKLPKATAFTASSIGGVTGAAVTIYTAPTPTPTKKDPNPQGITNCAAPSTQPGLNGLANYSLVSGNGTDANGTPQTSIVTVIPTNGTGTDYGWKLTTTNTQLVVGTSLLCYISTDSLYLNTVN